jgi:hypothetical protein
LDFIIYFDIFFMGLSRSYDIDNEFCRLTKVGPGRSNILLFQYFKKKTSN